MIVDNIQHHTAQQAGANGLQITYDSFGDPAAPAMILIMGLGTQMIHWSDQFCQLLASNKLRVIRFDNRDIGKSTWMTNLPVPSMWDFIGNSLFNKKVHAPYLLDDMADDTLALMDALNINKAHLVGASMGGMIAQCIALKSPNRVTSLTSIMSTTGNRSLPKAKARVSAKLLRPMAKDIEQYIAQSVDVWKMLHGDHFSFDQQRIENVIRDSRERGFNPAGVARQLSAIIDSPDRTLGLKQLQIPSLIIHGDIDPLVPVECGIATAAAIPHSTLKILEGMGHTLPVQLWQQIVDDIVGLSKAG
ncbi:MAG: pimeloyl-ACP methyl ester carboxylesterase [Patiriisocius sp.]|jgi:pimeloyl-ACP methyl ester carboxylesterase